MQVSINRILLRFCGNDKVRNQWLFFNLFKLPKCVLEETLMNVWRKVSLAAIRLRTWIKMGQPLEQFQVFIESYVFESIILAVFSEQDGKSYLKHATELWATLSEEEKQVSDGVASAFHIF